MVYKSSKQRTMVQDYLQSCNTHLSAEVIYSGLKKLDFKISLASVYRNLNILEDMHKIRKVVHPMIGSLYDKTIEPHDHLYCEKCHQLVDIHCNYDHSLDQEVAKRYHVRIQKHDTLFYGICEACYKTIKHYN